MPHTLFALTAENVLCFPRGTPFFLFDIFTSCSPLLICRADLENEAGGSSDDENFTPDPAATRWGTQTSESMHGLQVIISRLLHLQTTIVSGRPVSAGENFGWWKQAEAVDAEPGAMLQFWNTP